MRLSGIPAHVRSLGVLALLCLALTSASALFAPPVSAVVIPLTISLSAPTASGSEIQGPMPTDTGTRATPTLLEFTINALTINFSDGSSAVLWDTRVDGADGVPGTPDDPTDTTAKILDIGTAAVAQGSNQKAGEFVTASPIAAKKAISATVVLAGVIGYAARVEHPPGSGTFYCTFTGLPITTEDPVCPAAIQSRVVSTGGGTTITVDLAAAFPAAGGLVIPAGVVTEFQLNMDITDVIEVHDLDGGTVAPATRFKLVIGTLTIASVM